MTGVWIAVAAGVMLLAGVTVRLLLGRRRGASDRRQRAVIGKLADSTSVDWDSGAARSVQRADLLIEEAALSEIWTPAHLERLARTYWRFLTRVTLGLIRVHYTEGERSVVLVARPLRLLTFQAPEYEMDSTRGMVRWRIARGLLVSRRGRSGDGYLQIEVRRDRPTGDRRATGPAPTARRPLAEHPADDGEHVRLHVEVAVANFYPSIASRLGRRLYNATQSRIHVIVTYGFLRSLARLDLAESRVGRLVS
jgi:hypothetical protein